MDPADTMLAPRVIGGRRPVDDEFGPWRPDRGGCTRWLGRHRDWGWWGNDPGRAAAGRRVSVGCPPGGNDPRPGRRPPVAGIECPQRDHGRDVLPAPVHPRRLESSLNDQLVRALDCAAPDRPACRVTPGIVQH